VPSTESLVAGREPPAGKLETPSLLVRSLVVTSQATVVDHTRGLTAVTSLSAGQLGGGTVGRRRAVSSSYRPSSACRRSAGRRYQAAGGFSAEVIADLVSASRSPWGATVCSDSS